jgi:hypothetical protein
MFSWVLSLPEERILTRSSVRVGRVVQPAKEVNLSQIRIKDGSLKKDKTFTVFSDRVLLAFPTQNGTGDAAGPG